MTHVVGFWAKIRRNPTSWVIGFSNQKNSGQILHIYLIFRLHKQGHSFLRSKNINLKLEIEPPRKQPSQYIRIFPYTAKKLTHVGVGKEIRTAAGYPRVLRFVVC